MKTHKTVLLVALLCACSPGDAPAGADATPPAAPPAAATQPAPPAAAQPAPAPQISPAGKKFQEAAALIKKGDNAGAIAILEGLRKEGTAEPHHLSLLGALYIDQGRVAEGMAILKPLAAPEDADPAVLYNAGKAALIMRNFTDAQTYFERSVAKVPMSPASRELGLLLSRQGKVVEAYRYLRPWAIASPNDMEVRIIAATLALRLERPAEADALLSGLAENEPAIQLLRAQARIQRGDGKGALVILAPIEKNHPADFDLEVRRTLAEAHLAASDPASALKVLDGHTEGHASLLLLQGKAQRLSGNSQAAMATLKPLVAQLPDDPKQIGDPRPAAGVAVEYGRLLLAAKDVQGAVPMLEKATRLYPSSREAWEVYAEALTAAGRAQDAAAARQKVKAIADAAAANPNAAPAAAAQAPASTHAPAGEALSPNLAEALRQMASGQNEKALEAVRKEVAAAPTNPRARAVEVQLLLRMQRFPDALKAAEAAVAADPKNPDFLYLRGASHIALQQVADAEKDLRATLAMSPQHIGALNDLAVVMVLQKKPSEAQKLLEKVLALNPNDAAAKASLENVKKMAAGKG
ncbi:MAG TPA: tetratricopeptide repeat protein [Thermoanaerobaculia bacterium]|jgi:tetratricopeptide (TPR) repeat protein|nr:tetratricopeptide repeat protein [Thermoanaerobaculia bacterium]